MSCILFAIAMIFIVSSPPSLPVDLVPADDSVGYDYSVDDQVPFAEQPASKTPLSIIYRPTLFSLILALEMPCYYSIAPISMHSLIL